MLIITIHNDGTGNEEFGNYNVVVKINEAVIWQGRVEGHYRKWGWPDLLDRVILEADKDE